MPKKISKRSPKRKIAFIRGWACLTIFSLLIPSLGLLIVPSAANAADESVETDILSEISTDDESCPACSSIGGFVYRDTDGNGEVGDEESGLPGWRVALQDTQGNLISLPDGQANPAITDEDGAFEFDGLLAGEYIVIQSGFNDETYLQTYPSGGVYWRLNLAYYSLEVVVFANAESSTCASRRIDTPGDCTGEGVRTHSYSYPPEYSYCGQVVAAAVPDQTCNCIYSDWVNGQCSGTGKIRQTRTKNTDFPYCSLPLEQIVDSPACAAPADNGNQSSCGDGVKNGNEECDGTDGIYAHHSCGSDCKLVYVPYCGDASVDPGEECDGSDDCTNDCKKKTTVPENNPGTGRVSYAVQPSDWAAGSGGGGGGGRVAGASTEEPTLEEIQAMIDKIRKQIELLAIRINALHTQDGAAGSQPAVNSSQSQPASRTRRTSSAKRRKRKR